MGLKKTYKEFGHGVINDIEASEIPFDAIVSSDKFYFRENFWRLIPGLAEIHNSAIGTDPIWSVIHFHQLYSGFKFLTCATGSDIYVFTEGVNTWASIHSGLIPNQLVEFLTDGSFLYFGSKKDSWRRFDGGTITYPVGGAENAPLKFSKIIYNPYAQRYFAIGADENPLGLYFSEHIDDGGIELWPNAPQLIESVEGDIPLNLDIYEGRVTTVSENSISTGNVVGVPENWSFQKEKSQTGTIAGRTFKRYKSSFFMLTNGGDLFKWPENEFVNKGRVKFSIDPSYIHLATAEIVEDRYYYLCFKHGHATSTDKYHLWIYDILGDRFYGPHTQYNIVSMFYSKENKKLYCGGIDDLAGFVLDHRGRNIKNKIRKSRWVTSYSDYGLPYIEKRYNKGWIKFKQEGTHVSSEGQVELVFNSNNLYGNPQSQKIALVDPDNQNLSDTNAVKEAITKRFDIYDQYGLGNACQFEVIHEKLNADLAFSELTLDYDLKTYEKENVA